MRVLRTVTPLTILLRASARQNLARRDLKDYPVRRVQLVNKAQPASMGLMVSVVLWAPLGLQVLLVRKAPPASLVRKDLQAQRAPEEP